MATERSHAVLAAIVLFHHVTATFLLAASVQASPSDRSINSISFSPDNTFDNQLTSTGSDSGCYIQLNLSGGGAAANNPDNEGGYRLQVYNSSGELVRRLDSLEIDANPTAIIHWNGQGDSNVNDTLPYGSYTLRAFSSMRDPVINASIKGSGITIDRPGDLFVTSGGVLTWVNCGAVPGFCQASLGDPNTQEATFLRAAAFPNGFGLSNTNEAYGVVMNSKNELFFSENYNGGAAGMRIGKYATATETWIAVGWASAATTAAGNDDEFAGLGIDRYDSVFVAMPTGVMGGGAGGNGEYILKFKDNGTSATQASSTSQTEDYYDVAAVQRTGDTVYAMDRANNQIDRYTGTLGASADPLVDMGAGAGGRSIWATTQDCIYVADNASDMFSKRDRTGALIYSVSEAQLDGVTGIAVWQKTATNETFVIVASQNLNQIHLYKENPAGDSASYVRSIEEDVNNLQTPEGIAIDPDSAIFVVCRGARAVKKFSTDGVFMPLTSAANGKFIQGIDQTANLDDSTGFYVPRAICVDTAGFIYVFDHNNVTAPTAISLKKFSSDGTPLAVIMDVDGQGWSGVLNQPVTQATFGAGSIYAVTSENGCRVLRIGTDGTLLGHLGTYSANGGADAAEGQASQDVLSCAIAPCFDRTNNRYYPEALWLMMRRAAGGYYDRIEAWKTDLSGKIGAINQLTPQSTTNTIASANNPVTFAVDYNGEVYAMNDGASGGNYIFRKWNAASPSNQVVANSVMEFTFAQGSGASQFNVPREAAWSDARGVYKYNPTTGRYQRKLWINDSGNNRLQQVLLSWQDVKEQPIIIAISQDTPLVIAAALSGDSVLAIGGSYYATTGLCTMTVSFNKPMVTGPNPDTLTVTFKPNGGSFTSVNQVSYSGATWTGTATITSGMADGEAIIKVTDAYDSDGTIFYIDPNPDQTDFDVSDEFKPFIVDKTAPAYSLSSPPSSGDTASQATYTVSGQITSEATGLDATVQMINWTSSSGGTQTDSVTNGASAADGTFNGVLDLKGPAPTDNWIEVVLVDKIGNRTTLTPRRLVQRVKNVGNAYVDPYSEIAVGTLRRYQVTYTAAQDLVSDTLKFTVPASWSTPQKTSSITNGYVTVLEAGAYTGDSVFSGQTVTFLGVSRTIGQTLTMVYGDSSGGVTGRAQPSLDGPLDNVSNAFQVALQQSGETQFTTVSAQSGKTLTVQVKDSGAGIAVTETGPPSLSWAMIPKGQDTKTMTVRLYNSNLGNHTDRMTQLIVSVESETGGTLLWSNVASRVVLKNTGEGITFADVTSIPATPTVTITPANMTAAQGLPRDAELWVTFSAGATADTSRFSISGAAAISVVDSASGKSLTVVEQGSGVTGRKTGLYDIFGQQPADTMSVGGDTSITPTDVAVGQIDVNMMDLLFLNEPSVVDTPVNSVRIDQVNLSMRKSDGTPLVPSHVIKGIHLRDASSGFTYGGIDTPAIPNSGDTLTISLSGLTVASNQTVTVRVWVDLVADTVSASSFRMRLNDTNAVTAKDNSTQATVRVRDDPARSESLPFQTNAVPIYQRAKATLVSVTPMQADSTLIKGELGQTIVAGTQFLVGLCYQAATGRGAVRVIPSDTDLKFMISGVDRTNQFTVGAPAAKTIAAGSGDTVIYPVIQNLGSNTGLMTICVADTLSLDTRPRLFDAHDYTEPDKLRTLLVLPVPTDTVTGAGANIEATAHALDTTYANPGKETVAIITFQVRNNAGGVRSLDSVAIEGISCGSAVTKAHLYWDKNRNGVLNLGTDSWAVSASLSGGETALFQLSSTNRPAIAASSQETFFVCFGFAATQTDGDTFDARIPVGGVRVLSENDVPAASILNSTGEGRVEVVATRAIMSPDTWIKALGSNATATISAVDAAGNLDNVVNYETPGVQGRTLQVQVTVQAADSFTDTTHRITSTVGLTGVVYLYDSTTINGSLSNGQGQVSFTDTEAETVSVTVASILDDSTGAAQFANLITASAQNLTATDSGKPDSKAVCVLAFLVNNQTENPDDLVTVGVRSLNTADTNVTAVMLFRDANGNGTIDSGTDATLATSSFTNGFVTFSFTSTINNGDSALFMVGYNLSTLVTDEGLIDARADTVTMNSLTELAGAGLNSSPNRRVDVAATKLALSSTGSTQGTGSNVTVNVYARDGNGNLDIGYTGGTGITWDLTGSGTFGSTTLANEDIDPPPDPPYDNTQVKGNLVSGMASLTFTDATAETSVLTVVTAPGLSGTHDSGSYVFEQGFTATALSVTPKLADPGETNVVLLAFRVSASGVNDSVTQVKVNWTGTDTRDVTNVRLWKDADANEAFSATSDTLFTSAQSFSGDTVTYTASGSNESVYISSGTSKAFFLVCDIVDTARGGDELDAQVPQGGITTKSGITNVPSGSRNSTGLDTVARVPDTLSVGVQASANRSASENQTEIIPLQLIFSSPAAADRKFYIEQLQLRVDSSSPSRVPSNFIQQVILRNAVSAVEYATDSTIESSGDSIRLDIPFDATNPLTVGGTTPETVTVNVVVKIASTVTNNDTFALVVIALDSSWVRAHDHPLGTASPSRQKNNVSVLSPSSLPLRSGVVTVNKAAQVTQKVLRITDLSNNDITSMNQGEQFRVHVGLSATSGRASAQIRSSDTDLTFFRANGTVDITSEFTVQSRSHSTLTMLSAGAWDTITYDIVQGAPFSGGAETLVVNNRFSAETMPYCEDKNSEFDATKLRVYLVEDAQSTDAVRIDTTNVNVAEATLANNNIQPDSKGVVIMRIRVTDAGTKDTVTGIVAHLQTTPAASMIKSCWIALDTNKSGVFDTGVDMRFGAITNFKTSDTLYFSSTWPMNGSGDTIDIFLVVNMETGPITDSTLVKAELPVDGIGIQLKDSAPKTLLTNSAYLKTRVVATKLSVSPDTQTVSVGASASLSLQAVDAWGNVNQYANYATASTTNRINDTWTVPANRSARWSSTTLGSQLPASLGVFDTIVYGTLSLGAATVTMTDTQEETVPVTVSVSGLTGETVIVGFSSAPSVTAVALSNLMKISPDSTDAPLLVLDASYPGSATDIDSLYAVSENTADTCMSLLRLWVDNGDGILSTATDSNVDTAAWNNGSCSFLVGGRKYAKSSGTPTVRLFITGKMVTTPQVDNDSVGARINLNGIRLTPGGTFPSSGELDSISGDTQNAVIDIDAMQTGGTIRFVDPGAQINGTPFTVTIRAEDKYGNLDRVFTTLGSNASKNITLSASPADFTFNSTSMTTVSGWPGAAPVARFKLGADTILITPNAAGAKTLSTTISSSPPADTSISITVNDSATAGSFTADSLALPNDTVAPGATNVRIGSFYVKNGKASAVNVQTITIKNDGDHPDTGIGNVRIMIDTNRNGVYDAGTDYPFGTAGSFVSGQMSRTDSAGVNGSNDTVGFLVLVDMSATLTVDSKLLRARVEIGNIITTAGDTAGTVILRSNGVIRTSAISNPSAPNALDSVFISAGSAIADNFDTAVISVAVIDTNGVPALGRTVWLTGDTGAPITVVSSNPQTTSAEGTANFAVRTGTVGSYVFSASVNGVACGKSATATFITENYSSASSLGGNATSNTQRSKIEAGLSSPLFMSSPEFMPGDDNRVVYLRANGTNWELVDQTFGGTTNTWLSTNKPINQDTGQLNFLSSVRTATTNISGWGVGNYALCGVIHRASGRRAQIYAVNLTTGESSRIMPNNPASTSNLPFANITWRWFDIDPVDGETVVAIQDGNLISFNRASGMPFDNRADSGRIHYLSAWSNMYMPGGGIATNTRMYAAYPTFSPDGSKLAFCMIMVSDNLPNGPAVTQSGIYVLKNWNFVFGGYPVASPYPALTDTGQSYFVPVAVNDSFAFAPRWTANGDGIIYSVARGPDWDWQRVFKGYPQTTGLYDTSLFVTRFVYYNKNTDTAPYPPIDISAESFSYSGSLDVTMAPSGSRLAYVRKSVAGGNRIFELRTVDLGTEAAVTASGGVLFDSGRIVVVVPASESYAQGLRIACGIPDTTPSSADSVIITGAAKQFFAPNDTSQPVYFADSITVIMYYDRGDFTETELIGYDSDGDGIPDRTEAAVSAYFWNGTSWEDYHAVRWPEENKIEFQTMHFSQYAVGMPMQVRALAFGGSVADVIVYPNPWRSDGPTAGLASTNEAYGIKLTRMPGPDVRVRVFTLAGELVADGTVNALNNTSTTPSLRVTQMISNEGTTRGTVSWNLTNQSGRNVASGVYLIVLDGPGGRAVRKAAVIR